MKKIINNYIFNKTIVGILYLVLMISLSNLLNNGFQSTSLYFIFIALGLYFLLPNVLGRIYVVFMSIATTIFYIGFYLRNLNIYGDRINYLAIILCGFLLIVILLGATFYKLKYNKQYPYIVAVCFFVGMLMIGFSINGIWQRGSELYLRQVNFLFLNEEKFAYDKFEPLDWYIEEYGYEWYNFMKFQNDLRTINKDKDAVIINEFLDDNLPQNVNEYTNYFKGKDVVVMQVEGLNSSFMRLDLMPTLNHLVNTGWNFNNYSSFINHYYETPIELMANLSLIPNDHVMIGYYDNIYESTLADSFRNAGYNTAYYVNRLESYSNRDYFYKKNGYDNVWGLLNLGFEISNYTPKSKLLETMFWIDYYPGQHFTYVNMVMNDFYGDTTIDLSGQEHIINIMNALQQEELSDYFKNQIINMVELDIALSQFLSVYAQYSDINNLVLVLFGDMQEFDEVKAQAQFDPSFIIWQNQLEYSNFDKYFTPIDIAPTLYNLFGIEYNKNMILGDDVFDNNYRGSLSMDLYDGAKDSSYYRVVPTYKDIYGADDFIRYFRYKDISEMIIRNNYFND